MTRRLFTLAFFAMVLGACGASGGEEDSEDQAAPSVTSASSTTVSTTTTTMVITTSTTMVATTERPPTPPHRAFSIHCASCHGSHGEGITGPKLGGGALGFNHPDRAEQITIISDGLESGMPGFKNIMSAEEIEGVMIYINESLSGEP